MAQTCCPQYTIRLDAEAFKPNKKQRQVMSRWNRFLQSGVKPSEAPGSANVAASGSNVPASTQYNVNAKGKGKAASDWTETLRQFEADRNPDAGHRFEASTAADTTVSSGLHAYRSPSRQLRQQTRHTSCTSGTRWPSTKTRRPRSRGAGSSGSCAEVHWWYVHDMRDLRGSNEGAELAYPPGRGVRGRCGLAVPVRIIPHV